MKWNGNQRIKIDIGIGIGLKWQTHDDLIKLFGFKFKLKKNR